MTPPGPQSTKQFKKKKTPATHDVHIFCNDMFLNYDCPVGLDHLFDGDNIRSCGFVFEKPKQSYFDNKSHLDMKSKLDPTVPC